MHTLFVLIKWKKLSLNIKYVSNTLAQEGALKNNKAQ